MPNWKRPSPALVLSALALFVSLSGLGLAASGGNFILGTDNTADQQTKLSGSVANPQLRVENASASGGARGIIGRITSASAAAGSAGLLGGTASTDPGSVGVIAQNTGGGPALSALVNPGAPPFKVNSTAKVNNLNADQVDGLDSSTLVRSVSNGVVLRAGQITSGRAQLTTAYQTEDLVLLPSVAEVLATNLGSGICEVQLINRDPSETYAATSQFFPFGATPGASGGRIPPGSPMSFFFDSSRGGGAGRWQAWIPGDQDSAARVLSVETSIEFPDASTCDAAATAYVGGQ